MTRCSRASLDLDEVKFKRKRNTCNIWKNTWATRYSTGNYRLNKVLKIKLLRHLENKILTEPQPKKAKLFCFIRNAKLFFLLLDRDSNKIWKPVFISLWDTRRIKFSQSHSLKRLSCHVASGRPNCFYTNLSISEKRSFSSLRDTRRIKFWQRNNLKRLSCSIASGRPYYFTLIMLDTGSNNIWKRFLVLSLRHPEFSHGVCSHGKISNLSLLKWL